MSNYFRSLLRAQTHSLLLPKEHEAEIERYVWMHHVTRPPRESTPFPRKLDFWTFSVAAALAKGIPPREDAPPSKWGRRFIDTKEVEMDENLCALLAIVAVAKLGHEAPEVDNPRLIIDLGNRLAAVGCPVVLERLSDNVLRSRPLDRAINLAQELYHEVRSE